MSTGYLEEYSVGDFVLITGDFLGGAGNEFVSWVPLIVLVFLLGGGITLVVVISKRFRK